MLPPHPLARFSDLIRHSNGAPLSFLLERERIGLYYNARAVLYHLAQALYRHAPGRRRVLLPAFHCPSVVEPFLRAGMQPDFYRIDRSLGIDHENVLDQIRSDTAAALFINYFGLPSPFEPLLAEFRSAGVFVIEDCAHSFLQVNPLGISGRRADAAVYSFWKLVPSHRGGGLWLAPATPIELPALRHAPVVDILRQTKQIVEEAISDRGEHSALARAFATVDRVQLAIRQRTRQAAGSVSDATSAGPADEYAFDERLALSHPPPISIRVLEAADLAGIAAARRANYQIFASQLCQSDLLEILQPTLPACACPWAFPVCIADRGSHDLELRAREVPVWTFGSTLHRAAHEMAAPSVIQDAKFLSDRLLCLPIHQMVDHRHILTFCRTINQYSSSQVTDAH